MLVPLSWLKEYVNIKLPLKDLMWKMTEIGLTTETYTKLGDDVILDIEVTPNRADWLSIVGIARELSALQNTPMKFPVVSEIASPKANLPFKINNDFKLCPRYSAISIKGVVQAPSPKWMQDYLTKISLRPINNLVDVTNYVMFEFGNPIHVFDYDKLKNAEMTIMTTKGGEKFTSVDEISYRLPKDAIIFKSGIKGGANSGVSKSTKNILILVAIYDGKLIRRTSQKLDLLSDASRIFERREDTGGTLLTLQRTVNLMTELAGGNIASEIADVKKEKLKLSKLTLSLSNLEKVLGIKIEDKEVLATLDRLNLSPILKNNLIECTIPTYRADLKIEEDLIEEVARLFGYNKFPKTLPYGATPKDKIAYFFDPKPKLRLKELMFGAGFIEIQTLSLTSEEFINKSQLNLDLHIKIANPVSKEYEYLRTSLIPSLLSAVKLNSDIKKLKLYELNKVYFGPIDQSQEVYKLSGLEVNTSFRKFKASLDLIFDRLKVKDYDIKITTVTKSLWHPTKSGVIEKGDEFIGTFGEIHPKVLQNFKIKEKVWGFELDEKTLEKLTKKIIYKAPNQHPPQIEDITLIIPDWVKASGVIATIKKSDTHVSEIELTDIYQKSHTFRIWYQDPKKTMSDNDVKIIHNKILSNLNKKFEVNEKI